MIWSIMFVFTLVQSRTHVDTVHSDLHSLVISRDICWSHTMKVLGWHVTFVRRNSPWVLSLSGIYFEMKVWSIMCVVNVQSVFVQHMSWNLISWNTQTTNSFVVVYVVKILNRDTMLYNTLRDVPINVNTCVQARSYVQARGGSCLLVLSRLNFWDNCNEKL